MRRRPEQITPDEEKRIARLSDEKQVLLRFLLISCDEYEIEPQKKGRTIYRFLFAGHVYGWNDLLEFRQDELVPFKVLSALFHGDETPNVKKEANAAALKIISARLRNAEDNKRRAREQREQRQAQAQ